MQNFFSKNFVLNGLSNRQKLENIHVVVLNIDNQTIEILIKTYYKIFFNSSMTFIDKVTFENVVFFVDQ